MLYWTLASLFAFFVKGLCGFANTLVFTTVLSFGVHNIYISPVELLLGYPTNGILAWRERRSIRWKIWLPLSGLVVLGSVPGILFLKHADTGIVKMIFGAAIIVISLEMLLREFAPRKAAPSRAVLAVIGILSGLLCGLYGVGALLGAYLSRITDSSSAFKANICMVFLVENTLRAILYTVWGMISWDVVRQTALLVPFMLAGLALGMRSAAVLDERLVKRCVIVMLLLSGTALIAAARV